jgi:hypothetical protein
VIFRAEVLVSNTLLDANMDAVLTSAKEQVYREGRNLGFYFPYDPPKVIKQEKLTKNSTLLYLVVEVEKLPKRQLSLV